MSTAVHGAGVILGIYEKALVMGDLDALFADAARAGFSFVDLSLDESPERLARLQWTLQQRIAVRDAAVQHNITIGGVCLSVHRTVAPGSADPAVRERALGILIDAIDLCADLGGCVLQIAGYYAYGEDARESARDDYVGVLREGAAYAARRGVVLGLENVDGDDVTSTQIALQIVAEVASPWFALYPDIGNFVVQGLNPADEVRAASPHAVAWHVKDARRDEPRRVPMGEGDVPWEAAFSALAESGWSGRIMIEMWNDDAPESAAAAAEARTFIAEALTAAGIRVLEPTPMGAR